MLLSIDTSGLYCSVALFHNEDLLHYEICAIEHKQSEVLFNMIASALAVHQITYSQLTAIALTTGPGSFTGLRVGISAIKGISLVYPHLMILGISALEALQYSIPKEISSYSIINAGRNLFYTQKFHNRIPCGNIELVTYLKTTEIIVGSVPEQNINVDAKLVGLAALSNLKYGKILPLDPIYSVEITKVR